MSVNYKDLFTQEFTSNVQLLLQQEGSKLRDLVSIGRYTGKQASPVNQVGSITASKVTSRFAPMGRVDATFDRRWVYPTDYELPQLIDSFDELKTIVDLKSSYTVNAKNAMGRAIDDEIISAFWGTAKTGEAGGTSTTWSPTISSSYTSANASAYVANNFGSAAASGLTVAKLREAKRVLLMNEVDPTTDELVCIITSKQHDQLLSEAQVVSTDFNDKPVLVEGMITRFLGFRFVMCERLVTDGTYTRVPAYAKSGMHVGLWNDISAATTQREDLQGRPWQLYVTGTFGATRLEEKKLVEIKCVA